MKKNLISLFLAGTIFFSSFNKKEIKNRDFGWNLETELSTEKDTIKTDDLIYIKTILNEMKKINEEYLYENTAGISIFNNEDLLKKEIIKELKEKEHTSETKGPIFSENYSQINELSLNQNKVIYLMISSLKNSSFLNQIGKMIAEDVKNKYCEIGGIVNFKGKNKIELKCLESKSCKEKNEACDGEYLIPLYEFYLKKIAYFHLHARKYDEATVAKPGQKDISTIEGDTLLPRPRNEFIITSLRKGEFNADYIGVNPKKSKKAKIVDLGNYAYDTLKIK